MSKVDVLKVELLKGAKPSSCYFSIGRYSPGPGDIDRCSRLEVFLALPKTKAMVLYIVIKS